MSICEMWFLHLRNFGLDLSLSSLADWLNNRASIINSAECTSCFLAKRAIRLGHIAWFSHEKHYLAFVLSYQEMPPLWISNSSFLIKRFHPGHWPVKIFSQGFGEAHCKLNFGFIQHISFLYIYIYIYIPGSLHVGTWDEKIHFISKELIVIDARLTKT